MIALCGMKAEPTTGTQEACLWRGFSVEGLRLIFLLLPAYGSAAGLDTCVFTSDGLAWSTTCMGVSINAPGWESVSLTKFTHHRVKILTVPLQSKPGL